MDEEMIPTLSPSSICQLTSFSKRLVVSLLPLTSRTTPSRLSNGRDEEASVMLWINPLNVY